MGTRLKAGYESQTAGVTPSAANSSTFGDAPISIGPVIGSGGSATYDATHPSTGTMGIKLVCPASVATYIPYQFASDNASVNFRYTFYYTAAPTAEMGIVTLIDTGSSTAVTIAINTSGTLRIRDKVSASTLTGSNAIGSALTTGLWTLEVQVIHGTSTNDSSIHLRLYSTATSTTPTASFDATGTFNAGTTDFRKAFFGHPTGSAVAYTNYIDDVQLYEGLADSVFIGPFAGNPPVANMGSNQTVNAGALVTLTISGTNSPTSYSVSQASGTPSVTLAGTGTTRTFTAPRTLAGSTLVFNGTATNSSGTSAPASVTITVNPQLDWILSGGSWQAEPVNIL